MVRFENHDTGEVTDEPEPNTVEVVKAEFAGKADQLRNFAPTNPVEMEFFIREANALLEQMPDVLLDINTRRYNAERAHGLRKNTQMAFYGRQGNNVSFARALAEVDAQPELEVWHNAKAEYHYAEDTEKALRTKIFSMLNINRSIAAAYNTQTGIGR
ncbi:MULTISPECIES: hypothetical protein [unclassified Cryobacterium]|uniref:hypothetical protein n=1 Tax=unclassified Cryobacterium TaxID=2649013 RepID=UPI00106CF120|nr:MULTISPECIES: hypothetical protein [unclassified Cryobacterium]TFC59450.1 hypothetical protein E3O68_00695 [Cryobacterium sp. TMB3-1-2]TFC67246.1 hypothetical protein E3T21_17390 [Cryobacterium sp. TMB3-15]TFC73241.1 hypothetical protein E3T22_16665 [Cryobacterium sp. TMB3-10]TFD46129.1 hypothetical protein E3T58_01300 [Cryobacterium sp. TMB3-12]